MRTIKLLQNNPTVNTIALITIISLLMWSFGIHSAQADGITSFSDTLSESNPGDNSDHTIEFTTATGIANGETFTITFPSGFDLSSLTSPADFDLHGSTTADYTLVGSCNTGDEVAVSVSAQVITFDFCSTGTYEAVAGDTLTVEIGSVATTGATGSTVLTNHTDAGSYEITLGGTMTDSGATRIFLIDNIDMTATVETSFTFTITGVAADVAGANSESVTTKMATNSTAIPWGILATETPYSAAHTLSVGTNASNGFAVTLEQDSDLTNASTDTIDLFKDGAATATPEAWASPSGTLDSFDTYGHYGVTSSDNTLSGGDEFGTALYAGNIDSPRLVFDHSGPADGATDGTGTPHAGNAAIGYKIEISPLQEAGDYSNVLTYIATPTF